ncbi:MAG: uracil-DNA glycosylase [Chitinophagales bacterium]|nr:uracil-DNA glycosylase [Chitinophagales bacterium]
MSVNNIPIEASWKLALNAEFDKPYFHELCQFLQNEKEKNKQIFPTETLVFNAFNSTPINHVKVVIIGQDPYHGIGQAHGLCFSVQHGIKPPPSLMNIYKELKNTIPDFYIPTHGCLQKWANQGVFMLNAILTVEANKPASHQKKGWEEFTNAVIQKISNENIGIIFLLWGNFAQQKSTLIDEKKHIILKAAHPSPFSAHKGFLGCHHFVKVNNILRERKERIIDWQV